MASTAGDKRSGPFAGLQLSARKMIPGVVLVLVVTVAAYGFRELPGLQVVSPMISAIFIGSLFANFISVPKIALPGISLVGKRLLRLAVVLLGLQLTLTQVFEVGGSGMLLLTCVVAATYCFILVAGRLLGVDGKLTKLLAAGTSICGASAIAAANAIENSADDDVSYAVACVTLFGSIAIVLYPLLANNLLDITPLQYGFWAGASVHEVAQVVATGFQQGTAAGEFSVVVKLSRVLLLAPLLIIVVFLANGLSSKAQTPLSSAFPLFVVGFIVCMLLNTFGLVSSAIEEIAKAITPVMLTAALGALGLGTHFDALRAKGIRPLLLAALGSVFISGVTILMIPFLS